MKLVIPPAARPPASVVHRRPATVEARSLPHGRLWGFGLPGWLDTARLVAATSDMSRPSSPCAAPGHLLRPTQIFRAGEVARGPQPFLRSPKGLLQEVRILRAAIQVIERSCGARDRFACALAVQIAGQVTTTSDDVAGEL